MFIIVSKYIFQIRDTYKLQIHIELKMEFTQEEVDILKRYVSSTSSNIFVLTGLPGIIGAAFARYSRASAGVRETLLREFIIDGNIDSKKADGFIRRILLAYGDDSVGELEGAHLALEQISILATKEIEDRRIGGSPIEQSTRYVEYDTKDENGRFRFLREQNVMNSEFGGLYESTLTRVFEIYADIIPKLKEFFKKIKPLSEAEYAIKLNDLDKYNFSELNDDVERKAFMRTYETDIKTKSCDTARFLLPAATFTNMGVFANGRYFQNLLTHLYTLGVSEMNDIAKKSHQALDTVMMQYVKRAEKNEYLSEIELKMQILVDSLLKGVQPNNETEVVLLDNPRTDSEYINSLISVMIYSYSKHPMRQLRKIVSELPQEKKAEIIETYIGDRHNRRNRPGRALEFGYPLTFDLIGDFGIYRDLERHRILTQQRQRLGTELGYVIPPEIEEAGLKNKVEEAFEKSDKLYHLLKKDFSYESQYAVLLGYNVRWTFGMNPREAGHLMELRTIPQGHHNYRTLTREMSNQVLLRYPELSSLLKFVDHNNYYWGRADSEAGQRRKGG